MPFKKAIDWIKKNPLLALIIAFGVYYLWKRSQQRTFIVNIAGDQGASAEQFSSCLERKQIYLNSCDETEPAGVADVTLEKRFGKLYININANLPYARGGVFHTMYGAYHAFLVSSANQESINLGTLVRHGDHWYKLSNELLGSFEDFDRIDIYRQTEDYKPKRVLTGSIVNQNCSSL